MDNILFKNITFKIPILRLNLRDYSDEYIVGKRTINLLATVANESDKALKDVVFKKMFHLGHAYQKLTTN